MRVLTSPLSRCTETAALLGLADARTDSRLIEMHWGSWEGRTLAEIRRELGEVMQSNEARGWDFTPDGGESPRQVFNRVKHLLCDIASDGQPTLAIAHKGIIRVLYAAAADWNLLGRPPIKFDWKALHLFELNSDGQPRVLRMNIPLANRLVEAGH
jgi:probable phosphoglycerate mutase